MFMAEWKEGKREIREAKEDGRMAMVGLWDLGNVAASETILKGHNLVKMGAGAVELLVGLVSKNKTVKAAGITGGILQLSLGVVDYLSGE